MMTTTTRLLLLACMMLPLAACQKEAAPVESAVDAPVAVPTSNDDAAWGNYLTDVVRRNLGKITNSPYLYYLPAESTPGFDGEYLRQLEKTQDDLLRGILPDNMLAFGSPASARMADLIAEAFAEVEPDSMDGVRVLFIGDLKDSARVKAAVEPSGATYTFVEAK